VFRWQPAPGTSYQGFVKMLGQWQPALLAAIVSHLREQMQAVGAAQWETAGYVVFAGDGSRAAQTAQLELDWALVGLWSVGRLGQRELAASGQDPTRLSPAATIRAFQGTLRAYRVRPDSSAETLWAHLRRAVRDDYQRRSSKTSRSYPRKKQRAPIGVPTITRATPDQIIQATELKQHPELRTAWPSGKVTAGEAPKLRPVPGGLTGPALLGQPEDPELPQAA
jgi:hypothetical protein